MRNVNLLSDVPILKVPKHTNRRKNQFPVSNTKRLKDLYSESYLLSVFPQSVLRKVLLVSDSQTVKTTESQDPVKKFL